MGNTFRILSSILVGVVVAWTVAFVLANLLQCIPISANWTSWTGHGYCVNLWRLYLAQAWSDVLTDRKRSFSCTIQFPQLREHKLTDLVVLILSLPIPCVWVPSRVFKTAAKCLIDLGSPNGCEVQDCCDRSFPCRNTVSLLAEINLAS